MTRALIVEDEPLLAAELRDELARQWPELVVAASVADGHAALREIDAHHPEVLFLDVHMPGLSGLEIARVAGARCHVVFITAFDRYAVAAFEEGAVDYLLKPLDPVRLARALARVRERLSRPPADLAHLLERLHAPSTERMQWVTVLSGREVQFIAVDDVLFFRSDNRYTEVVTEETSALISTPIRELLARLDPAVFWQINRGVIVNAHAIRSIRRTLAGQLDVHLRRRDDVLRVSAAHMHLFKHM